MNCGIKIGNKQALQFTGRLINLSQVKNVKTLLLCMSCIVREMSLLDIFIYSHLRVITFHSEEAGTSSSSKVSSNSSDGTNNLELGLSQWKVQKLTALGIGAPELRSLILKVLQFPSNINFSSFLLI